MMHDLPKHRFHDPEAAERALNKVKNLRRIQATMIDAASKDCPGDQSWFVLQVPIGSETTVGDRLNKKNIHNWIPARKVKNVRSNGRTKPSKETAAFPGYVLVRVVPSAAAWMGLAGVKGVAGLLNDGENPIRVSDQDMNKLNELIASGWLDDGNEHMLNPELQLIEIGEEIRVTAGPFSGFTAIVTALMDVEDGFVDVEVMVFGRATPLRFLPLACIERIA